MEVNKFVILNELGQTFSKASSLEYNLTTNLVCLFYDSLQNLYDETQHNFLDSLVLRVRFLVSKR